MEHLTEQLEAIKAAQERLKGILLPTSLIESEFFSAKSDNQIFLKPENLQRTGSFKVRGAYNKIAQLTEEERAKGIVTASAGNHAQGVAYAAQQFKCPCTIVMPEVTPLLKIEAAKEKGAQVEIHGQVYDEAYERAMAIAEERGATFVHAYDDEAVFHGQGTISLELLEEMPDLDMIIVPIGGGGLIAGIALAAKALKPSIKVIGVEPEGAASMKTSISAGHTIDLKMICTCAEGVAVRKVGEKTFPICERLVDEIITVPERDIMKHVVILLEKHKLAVEASGVLPLAALPYLSVKYKKIACLMTGGNIDMVTLSSMINKGLVDRGRILAFSVDLLDRPGQLQSIVSILAQERANVISLHHDVFKSDDPWRNRIALEVTVETNGHGHIAELLKVLESNGYFVKRLY